MLTQEQIDYQTKAEKLIIKEHGLKASYPLYLVSPTFSFVLTVILAPIGEECFCRYLFFEIFGKKNPFAYLASVIFFIFFH